MSSLTIGRWHTRYRGETPPDTDDLRTWNEAPRHLRAPALADTDAIICVRHLHIRAAVRPGDSAVRVGELLEQALTAGLAALIIDGTGRNDDVIIWRDRQDALADMLYRACCGDTRRAWAWRQAGLLPPGTEDARAVRDASIETMVDASETIWPVLSRLILAERETGALTALMADMPPTAWVRLLPVPFGPSPTRPAPLPSLVVSAATDRPTPPSGPVADALLSWAAAQPYLARRLRPVLTALLTMAAAPATIAWRHPSAARTAAVTAALDRVLGPRPRPPSPAPLSDPGEPHGHTTDTALDGAPAPDPATRQTPTPLHVKHGSPDDAPAPAPPPLPDRPDSFFSAWAGLLFLLPLLPDTGLLTRIDDDPDALAGILTALAWKIGAPPDDPAVLAFRGGVALDAPPDTGALSLADHTAAKLEDLLSARLGPPPAAEDWLPTVCRRDGQISIEPGWIEIEFAAETADPLLRRGAIDLDPGFVPFLGCVVRYRYV